MSKFKITPILLGENHVLDKSIFTYFRNFGTIIKVPFISYLVQDGERNILIDSGVNAKYIPAAFTDVIVAPDQEIEFVLKEHGLELGDIDTVIWTHMHWDHTQNAGKLKNAKFIVQKREIEYAVNPLPAHRLDYELGYEGIQPEWTKVIERIEVIDGEKEITKGIRVIPTPGHTPGFQSVIIEGIENDYIIIGDTMPLVENWNPNINEYIPNGIHNDLGDLYKAHKILLPYYEAGFKFLHGHDYSMLNTLVYK